MATDFGTGNFSLSPIRPNMTGMVVGSPVGFIFQQSGNRAAGNPFANAKDNIRIGDPANQPVIGIISVLAGKLLRSAADLGNRISPPEASPPVGKGNPV